MRFRYAICYAAALALSMTALALTALFTTTCASDPRTGPERFSGLALAEPLKAFGDGNPIMLQEFGADPNVLVWDDRLYVFMTADALLFNPDGTIRGEDYGTIRSLRVASTSDLVNWTHHPDIQVAGPGGVATWAANSWAPALAAREVDGRMQVFLYFSNNAHSVGVISADHPLGPWRPPRATPVVSRSTPNVEGVVWVFDPAVLVGDDGRAFLYFGGGTPPGGSAADFTSNHPWPGTKRVVELAPNMIDIIGTPVALDIPFSFEAIEINKINGRYILSYSTNPQVGHFATRPNDFPYAARIGETMGIAYMVGDNPMGPFALQGLLLRNPGHMFGMPWNNNHHRVFEFRGEWYIAYHTKLLQAARGINLDFNYRSVSIDRVDIRPDGTIDLVEGTRRGVAQSGYFDPYQLTDAATMAVMAGISTAEYLRESSMSRHMKVTGISSGDWVALRGVDFGSEGATQFFARVNPPAFGRAAAIQVRIGQGLNSSPAGYVEITPGRTDYTIDLLRAVTGVNDLIFVFHGEGWDFKQWQFFQ